MYILQEPHVNIIKIKNTSELGRAGRKYIWRHTGSVRECSNIFACECVNAEHIPTLSTAEILMTKGQDESIFGDTLKVSESAQCCAS